MCAGKHRLDNLTAIVDYNKHQSYGSTNEVQDLEPFADKWRASGSPSARSNGHDVGACATLRRSCRSTRASPPAIICHTVKGKGVTFAENNDEVAPQEQGDRKRSRRNSRRWSADCGSVSTMRERCLNMIHKLAGQDERVVFVGSDLGVGTMRRRVQGEFPERHLHGGHAKQNLVGLSAGLAMEGRVVYLNTIATFLTRRCYEQVAVDLCLHNLPCG